MFHTSLISYIGLGGAALKVTNTAASLAARRSTIASVRGSTGGAGTASGGSTAASLAARKSTVTPALAAATSRHGAQALGNQGFVSAATVAAQQPRLDPLTGRPLNANPYRTPAAMERPAHAPDGTPILYLDGLQAGGAAIAAANNTAEDEEMASEVNLRSALEKEDTVASGQESTGGAGTTSGGTADGGGDVPITNDASEVNLLHIFYCFMHHSYLNNIIFCHHHYKPTRTHCHIISHRLVPKQKRRPR